MELAMIRTHSPIHFAGDTITDHMPTKDFDIDCLDGIVLQDGWFRLFHKKTGKERYIPLNCISAAEPSARFSEYVIKKLKDQKSAANAKAKL